MIDFEKKGFFNIHTLLIKDDTNLSNTDNKHIYSQMMFGSTTSPMLSYLLNLNKQKLNDFKSIMFYNESNLSVGQKQKTLLSHALNTYKRREQK